MAKKVNTSQMMKNGKNHGNIREKNEEVRSMKNVIFLAKLQLV